MAEATGKGSILYKLIIVVLIAVVIASVSIPKKEWNRQEEERNLCRLHMENVYFSSLQFLKEFKSYPNNLTSILEFMETDSMLAPPGIFEIERLTIWESPRDSFLVGFTDMFHYQRIDWNFMSPETVSMILIPKERFSIVPESRMVFSSDDSIFVERREKGEEDIYLNLWGKSRINFERLAADSTWIPTKSFAVSQDPEEYRSCPSSNEDYLISTNIRPLFKGLIEYTILRNTGGNVSDNSFLSSLFVKKLRSDAAVEVLRIFNADTALFMNKEMEAKELIYGGSVPDTMEYTSEDSTLIATTRDSLINIIKDSLLTDYYNKTIKAMKPRAKILLDEEATRVIDSEDLALWDDSLKIRDLLFNPEMTPSEQELSQREDVQNIFKRMDTSERYYIAKIDTVGLTISCPIDSVYRKPHRSILEKIFGVGPTLNHGDIANGDYSWEDKK